jgi:hypothetical protein
MDYVEVDLADAFCPQGCCRPLHICIDLWIVRFAPKRLVVTGLRAGEQAKLGFRDRQTLQKYTVDDLKVEYGLQFERYADKVTD